MSTLGDSIQTTPRKPIPYGRQHITDEDVAAVVETLRSDFLTQGPKVVEFEKDFAEYIGAQYAVAVANGTAALHLCALALEVKAGDKVITSPMTFAASANCVRYCGGEVYFCDIDAQTRLIDLEKLSSLLAAHPKGTFKGIIPVDFAGYPVQMDALKQLADEYKLWIIEDACHAPGGEFKDGFGAWQRCGNGNYADLAIFSFHPVKHIATGEGGMITTNRKDLYEKLLLLRTHGITKSPDLMTENHGGWYYEMQTLGYNYRLPDMLAALGMSQLRRAEDGLKHRRDIAARYNEAFNNTFIESPQVLSEIQHAYHLYTICTPNRLELYNFLRTKNIFSQVHYIPVHLLPYYRKLGWNVGDFPVAESYYAQCLSLPMYPSLTDADQDYVIETILSCKNQ